MRLQDRVAIVTGGGAGIGEAIARGFAREGAKVVVAELDPKRGEKVAGEITKSGGQALFVQCDVASTASVEQLARASREKFGDADILVNNAAVQMIGHDSRTHEVSEEVWDRTMDINLKGVWRCMKAYIPQMLSRGGSIINIASPTGMLGVAPGYSAYSTSKGGVFGLSRVSAAEYARDGIRINAVVPGTTATPLIADMLQDSATKQQLEAKAPLGRLGTPEDLVGVAIFLASDDSSYCTGGVYMADGGMTAI